MHRRSLAWKGIALLAQLVVASPASAEQPPLRFFTSSDGLAHDRVTAVLADSRGFLWFGTGHGLSRFDGSRFTTYGAEDGLSVTSIRAIVEHRRAGYLIGTNGGGVGWYQPEAAIADAPRIRMFAVDPSLAAANRVNALLEDRGGRVWVGTDGGLFELTDDGASLTFARVPLGTGEDERVQVWAFAEDSVGHLWIGSSRGLARRSADGRLLSDAIHPAQGADHVRAVLFDPSHGVWAAHDAGLFLVGEPSRFPRFARRALPGALGHRLRLTTSDGLPNDRVYALALTGDGLWVGTAFGLARLRGTQFSGTGLSHVRARTLAIDHRADLWVGTIANGVAKLAADGLTTYAPADGLAHPNVRTVFGTRDGRLAVVTDERALSLFDGARFTVVRPRLPGGVATLGRGTHVAFLEDRRGDWWVPSGDGLFRFTGIGRVEDLARVAPSDFYTTHDGLAGGDIWRLFEDSRGDIWIATRVPGRETLTRWDQASGRFHRYGVDHGLPANNAVIAIAEAPAGQVWVGLWDGGAARFRSGRFERLDGVGHPVIGWHVDRAGGLWGATLGGGLLRIEQPDSRVLQVATISAVDGLPSDRVIAVTEDLHGRIYAGSLVGVARLDPSTGHVRHYTIADGLARNEVTAAFRDRDGDLWFGTNNGVSRLRPRERDPAVNTRPLIQSARMNGSALAIPDLGTTSAGPFEFGAGNRNLDIEFLTLATNRGSGVQYRLEGADQEWTHAADHRSVTYALLPSGSYRFVVRARDGDEWRDASLSFTIRPPVWQRWWFVAGSVGLLALGLLAAHRARVARLVALERVRTRIASDLHDDIGSNLSQIAILGEVLRHPAESAGMAPALAKIAELSRESVDALSDIVWSIDPGKDHLNNLVMRMRRLASDVLASRDVAFTFDVHGQPDVTVGAEVRREVFLAFKETLNNVVRHAGCRAVEIDVRLERGRLGFTVRDDGRGFDTAEPPGHGLTSLRARAARLGGSFSVISSPGTGTTVELAVPATGGRHA